MIPNAKKYIWIATADIKDLHVKQGRSSVPFLDILAARMEIGVLVRLIHAKYPESNRK